MTRPGTLILAALTLAACSPKSSGSANPDSHAPGTTLATVPGSCASYPAGAPGVIRTFCDGTAVVKVQVAGVDHTLSGGTCSTSPVFSLNLGVVSNDQLGGPKPDYVGLTVLAPPAAGAAAGSFANAVLAVTVGGKTYSVTRNTGTAGPAGGTFTGTARKGVAVTGSFTC
jgi:hypothetical protein